METISTFIPALLSYLKHDLGVFFLSLLGALALYAVLYFFDKKRRPLSLRGFARYMFPREVFGVPQARIDLLVFAVAKISWTPAIIQIMAFLAIEATALKFLNASLGDRALANQHTLTILVAQLLAPVIAGELAFYWAHRALHQNRFLWSLHRPHHSAETLSFLTADRAHPLETLALVIWNSFWSGCTAAAVSYASGVAMHPLLPIALLIWSIAAETVDKLQHSHVRTSFGMLNYIVPSGDMHKVHHGADLVHRDKNFGGILSIFDGLFGTLYIPKPDEPIRLGLSDAELGASNPYKNVIDVYTEPFAYAMRALKSKQTLAGMGQQ